MALIEVSKISKKYQEENYAIRKVSFKVDPLHKLAIVGETGSGKSTLLKIIGGLEQPDAGDVFYQGGRVEGPNETLVPGHPKIAYLSQHFELPKHYIVETFLEDRYVLSEAEASKIHKACQIQDLLQKKTTALSGGERQRVALAKKLSSLPEVLLLDEPFSNLDMLHNVAMKKVIENVIRQLSVTCILVSHNPEDILAWADEIFVMKGGHIIQKGSPSDIYTRPRNRYVAGLFGKFNLVDTNEWKVSIDRPKVGKNGCIVRPEELKLTMVGRKNKKQGIEGAIQHISYHGNHDEIIVKSGTQEYIAWTRVGAFTVGQAVSIALQLQ